MMMEAALQRHDQGRADSIVVSLLAPYGELPFLPLYALMYAPDGCGFSGQDCTDERWREPVHGSLPEPDPEPVRARRLTEAEVEEIFKQEILEHTVELCCLNGIRRPGG